MSEEIKKVLNQSFPNIQNLCNDEIIEITKFLWLWPAFEAKHCGCDANIRSLRHFITTHTVVVQKKPFTHFKQRYSTNADAEERFNSLIGQRRNGCRRVINDGFADNANDEAKNIALACIVYRLRNNLFHGEKGSYDFKEQLENFQHANALLTYWLSLPPAPSGSA